MFYGGIQVTFNIIYFIQRLPFFPYNKEYVGYRFFSLLFRRQVIESMMEQLLIVRVEKHTKGFFVPFSDFINQG